VNGFSSCAAPASKPGGDLLFHCLSNSTIGAVWFHGRVRDGIGWVTDAMATKLWSRRNNEVLEIVHLSSLDNQRLGVSETRMKRGLAEPQLVQCCR
jgi:hypothetical protein